MSNEPDCLFCKIAAGEFGTEFLYESETVVAFNDLQPQASYHVLVVPKAHVTSIDAVGDGDGPMLLDLVKAVQAVAETRGLSQSGYRVITNHGRDAGQTVHHLHLHVLGGNDLGPLVEK